MKPHSPISSQNCTPFSSHAYFTSSNKRMSDTCVAGKATCGSHQRKTGWRLSQERRNLIVRSLSTESNGHVTRGWLNRIINSSVWNPVSSPHVRRAVQGWKGLSLKLLLCLGSSGYCEKILLVHLLRAALKLFQALLAIGGTQTRVLVLLCFLQSPKKPLIHGCQTHGPIRWMSNPWVWTQVCGQDDAFPVCFPFKVRKGYLGWGTERAGSGCSCAFVVVFCWGMAKNRVCQRAGRFQCGEVLCLVQYSTSMDGQTHVRGSKKQYGLYCMLCKSFIVFFNVWFHLNVLFFLW